MYPKYIKRIIDILCALAAIIVFSWLYLIVAVLEEELHTLTVGKGQQG